MKTLLLTAGVAALLSFPVSSVQAQEGMAVEKSVTVSSEEKPAQANAAPAKEKNPYQDEIVEMAKILAKEYNQDQAMALAQIRNGFGMVRAVGMVKKDVSKAVTACGEKNPGMKDKIAARFDAWSSALDPLLKTNQERMDESIHKIGFPDEKKVKSYLALVDKSAEYADSKIEKNIVTTPEACGNLLESMDRTGPTMAQLLDSIAWPGLVSPAAPAPENKNDDAAPDVKSVP